jgi:TRAP-type C4-dicarboxylate transport system substrate-binding protein
MRRIAFALTLLAPLATSAEPVPLKFSFPSSPQSTYLVQSIGPWVAEVNKAGGDAVDVKLFAGTSIANYNNVYDRIINGVVEIGYGIFGPMTGQFPKTDIVIKPFEAESCTQASVALWRLYEQGMIADEFAKVRPLALFAFPSSGLHSKKQIRTLDDYNGQKVVVTSRTMADIVDRLGGVPVTLTPTDIYASLQRNVATGAHIGWAAVLSFKLYEVASFHLDVPLGNSPGFIFMNKDAYARLPQKGKDAVDRVSYLAFSKSMGASGDWQIDHNRNEVRGMAGQTVYALEAAQTAVWQAKTKPVADALIRDMPDGEKVLAAFRAELKKAKPGT